VHEHKYVALRGIKRMPLAFLSHHKCATTWFGTYLLQFASLNNLTCAITHFSDRLPTDADVVFLTNANYGFISSRIDRAAHVIRNPLSIVPSAYFSHRYSHSTDSWPELVLQRSLLNAASEHEGLFLTLAFLEREDFYQGAVGSLLSLRTWKYEDQRYRTFLMEELTAEVSKVFSAMLEHQGYAPDEFQLPDPEAFVFEKFSGGRSRGVMEESAHYRSGDPENWRLHLSPAMEAYVRSHLHNVMQFYPN
jgi:hypothetical protein